MLPGAIIKVTKLADGLPSWLGPPPIPELPLMSEDGFLAGPVDNNLYGITGARIGSLLEVLDPPRRRNNVNMCKVKLVNSPFEGYMYWCHVYHSCVLVTPGNANVANGKKQIVRKRKSLSS